MRRLFLRRILNRTVWTDFVGFCTDCVEEERHKAFQALRKKHYEMKDAIKLGHQLEEEEEEDNDEKEMNEEVNDDAEEVFDDDDDDDNNNPPMVNGHNSA